MNKNYVHFLFDNLASPDQDSRGKCPGPTSLDPALHTKFNTRLLIKFNRRVTKLFNLNATPNPFRCRHHNAV